MSTAEASPSSEPSLSDDDQNADARASHCELIHAPTISWGKTLAEEMIIQW